ncbi:hypothetical protein DL96DRAFT_1716950 [Flagelloscypha sp. PMI_526]|nr:hypothetical protein DL96DRAFT_1716950 [Flagelloscypha sp. PMI_526]
MTGVHLPSSPPLVLTRQLAAGNPLSSNGCTSAITTPGDDGNEDKAGWRVIEKGSMFVSDKPGTLKQAAGHTPKPLTLGVLENKYEGEGDEDVNAHIDIIRSTSASSVSSSQFD